VRDAGTLAPVPARLYALPASHPSAAIERAIELKGLEYRRIDLIPVLHKPLQQARFGGATVPGVVFEDGAKVLGSRAIVRELERRVAEPPLLPADPDVRREVEAAEQWGDEVLQPLARRVIWAALRRRPDAMQSFTVRARLPLPAVVQRLSGPAVARMEIAIHGAQDSAVRADLMHLDEHLERVERWLDAGALGGERPNAADLQVGSGLALLGTLDDLRERLDRPAGKLAGRWFPDYPGRVPAGTLPAEWLVARVPG
jgi:glutathione S-transferase